MSQNSSMIEKALLEGRWDFMGFRQSKFAFAAGLLLCTSLLVSQSSMSQPGQFQRSLPPDVSTPESLNSQPAAYSPQVVAPAAPFLAQAPTTQPTHPFLNHLEALRAYAQQITVRVLVGEQWGSGTVIQQWGQFYRIVTNRHVLTPGETYQVEMPDGQVYPAVWLDSAPFPNRDLAVLQVQANTHYAVVQYLADSSGLLAGSPVIATGFPFDQSRPTANGFRFTVGLVALISDRELNNGYQIGYTNDIVKGMSGGPVLDWNGLLVGINGIHAYPLWGSFYNYMDGEAVNPQLAQQMTQYSWAIPINTFTQFFSF